MYNHKYVGEMGQNAVIGELAKYGVDVAVPLSDNHPFDFIVVGAHRLFKVQVKSSSRTCDGGCVFSISTNNFYSGESRIKYTEDDCDVVACYDLVGGSVYLLEPEQFIRRASINIRNRPAKNAQTKGCNFHDDLVLCKTRIGDVFGIDTGEWDATLEEKSLPERKKTSRTCLQCNEVFETGYKRAKYCSNNCKKLAQRKVKRPSKEQLKADMEELTWVRTGKKYGVSDNAARKWAKSYGLL